MVNVNCTGGGGNFQDDVTAAKAHVVQGYSTLTSDSGDEIIAGTMAEIGATNKAVSSAVSASALSLRMTNGAHRTNGTTGYPEVYIPLSDLRSTIGYTDASKVLTGTTIAGLQGTMPNNGAFNRTLGVSGQVTIPAGYHDGQGKITRPFTLYSPSGSFTPGSSDVTIPTSGKFISSDIKCAGDANLIASNIKHGVTIFGVTGTYVSPTIYDGGDGQALFNITPGVGGTSSDWSVHQESGYDATNMSAWLRFHNSGNGYYQGHMTFATKKAFDISQYSTVTFKFASTSDYDNYCTYFTCNAIPTSGTAVNKSGYGGYYTTEKETTISIDLTSLKVSSSQAQFAIYMTINRLTGTKTSTVYFRLKSIILS